MKPKISILLAVALGCMALMLVSCESLTVGWKSGGKPGLGPPPHAPAHGYRHKYQGVELVYDSGRGVYVVVEFPDHYYYKDHYYRLENAQWQVGVHINGPWEPVSEEFLPPGLRAKEKEKGKSKEHPGRGLGTGKKK